MHCASRRLPARAAPIAEENRKTTATLRVAQNHLARRANTRRLNRPSTNALRVTPPVYARRARNRTSCKKRDFAWNSASKLKMTYLIFSKHFQAVIHVHT
ncbi:hypothetical protein A2U01_0068608, partial [Trifolium medium]|nr:hypothetical protein [Trifolium medium]